MKYSTTIIILRGTLFALNLYASQIMGQVLPNKISHTSGSTIINGNNVTVTQSGYTDTITTYCPNITSPYVIGFTRPNNSSSGEYTFSFSPPVDSILLNFSGVSNIDNDIEEIYIKVNGQNHSITRIGVNNTCDGLAKISPTGGIAGCDQCKTSGWAGTLIPYSISTISIKDTVISGFPGGSVFSIYFYNDTTTSTENYINPNEINIYPNPVENSLFIKHSQLDELHVSLLNINSQKVSIKFEITSDIIFANLTTLHSGLYFLQILKGNSIFTKLLLKK